MQDKCQHCIHTSISTCTAPVLCHSLNDSTATTKQQSLSCCSFTSHTATPAKHFGQCLHWAQSNQQADGLCCSKRCRNSLHRPDSLHCKCTSVDVALVLYMRHPGTCQGECLPQQLHAASKHGIKQALTHRHIHLHSIACASANRTLLNSAGGASCRD